MRRLRLRTRGPAIATIAVVAGLLATAESAVASTLVKSKFATTEEGWKQAVVPASPAAATWSTDGAPPGSISQSLYNISPYYFYWQAPVAFLNNKVAAYKGKLEFDQYFVSFTSSLPRDVFVFLLDQNGTKLLYTMTGAQPNGGSNFTHHQVPLSKNNWHNITDDVDHGQASGDQLKHALRHLAELDIETHDAPGACTGTGTGRCYYVLDNVKLKTP